MAFSEPKDHDLLYVLREQSQIQIESNLLLRCTLGLPQLFTEISAAAAFGGTVAKSSSSHSDSKGHLEIGTSNPTLAKRYRLQEIIGVGTFSRIFKAIDIYSGNSVAVKIMRVGYHALGTREVAFLRYFNSKEIRGPKHFLNVLGAFKFEKHFCIVLDLYDSTLLSMLCLPGTDGNTAGSSQNSEKTGFRSTIHQPRVIRNKIAADSSGSRSNEVNGHVKLRALDIKKLTKIATSLTMALCLLRNDGAIHADIKPENCLIGINSYSENSNDRTNNGIASCSNPSNRGSTSPSMTGLSSASILLSDSIYTLPENFEIRLGDFGNSIHVSDVSDYYTDFDIQTLSYRAPEVLLGIPFGHQIDVWSLGILIVEICIGRPLFVVRTRQELYDAICSKLTVPPRVRFAGGMFSELLIGSEKSKLEPPNWGVETPTPLFSSSISLNTKINFAEHLSNIKKLLEGSVENPPNDLVHFLGGLLHPDPDYRLTAIDAHNHPFIASGLNVPLCMTAFQSARQSRFGAAAVGLKVLRSNSSKCDNLRIASNNKEQYLKSTGLEVLSVMKPIPTLSGIFESTDKKERNRNGNGLNIVFNELKSDRAPDVKPNLKRPSSPPSNLLQQEALYDDSPDSRVSSGSYRGTDPREGTRSMRGSLRDHKHTGHPHNPPHGSDKSARTMHGSESEEVESGEEEISFDEPAPSKMLSLAALSTPKLTASYQSLGCRNKESPYSPQVSSSYPDDKSKLPVEIQRMKSHDFLFSMNKPPGQTPSGGRTEQTPGSTNRSIDRQRREIHGMNDSQSSNKQKKHLDLT